MIFRKKKELLVWCDDPLGRSEDRVIFMFAGLIVNHDPDIANSF